MRRASRTRPAGSRRPHYHPHLVTLEERLPLGDGVLGLLVGAALLPAHAASAAASPTPQLTGESGVSVVGRIFNPSAWPDGLETRPTEAFAGTPPAALAAPDWVPLPDLFAPAARRRHDTLVPSPQREQGADAAPVLALRAPDAHAVALPTHRSTPASASDVALLATLVGMRPSAAPPAGGVTPTQEAAVKESFGQLPLYFEQNVGQTDAQVHFFARGPGYGLYLTSTEAVMVLQRPTPAAADDPLASGRVEPGRLEPPTAGTSPAARQDEAPPAIVRLQLVGANATPAVTGRDAQPGKVNYFLGSDPTQWHTNIATFGRVAYDDVYPGIDVVYYGNQRQLEYDFIVSPGADPSAIRLNVSGAERLELDPAGDLLIHAGEPGGVSPGSTLRQHKPFVYQTVGSTRQEVASRFVLEGQDVRFAVGAYDAGRPLVIDPVLSSSTYLGGSGTDGGYAIAVDPATGDALVTGTTQSTDFPTTNPLQATHGGGIVDVFGTRLNAAGSALVFSTYLGGSSADLGEGIAVDPATGDVLVTGRTQSTDFPTANPFQPTFGGTNDVFVTRIGSPPVAYYYVYPDSGQVPAGVPFDLYVFALDAQFHVIPDYTGLILFWATDPLASTPVYYQYQRTDRGIASFPGGLTFNTVGVQELYVFDWPGVQVFGYAAFDVRP